jgi:death-on-curing protein
MRYLTVTDVAYFNERIVGPGLLRDFGLLESAVFRPQTTVGGEDAYPDLVTKAAALFHSICRNHAFVNGNKRTAVVALVVFCRLNGAVLEAEDGELVGLATDTAAGFLDVGAIAEQLKPWVHGEWPPADQVDIVIEVDDTE